MTVTVYSTPTCPFCARVKEYLKRQGIAFTDKNVEADIKAAEEMVSISGQRGVPVTVVGDQVIVGFDQPRLDAALAHLKRPRLSAAVADAATMADRGQTRQRQGAYVGRVRAGGAAAQAGLRAGDVITSFAGRTVQSAVHLEQLVASVPPGSRIPVVYVRDEARRQTTLQF